MAPDSSQHLESVFGEHPPGLSDRDIARRSERRFVRSNNQISAYDPDRKPTGHVLTAWEAYDAFGMDVLVEALEYGAGIILARRRAVESSLKDRREELGLSRESVAKSVGVSSQEIRQAEEDARSVEIQSLERIAFGLGLDDRLLAYHPTAGADDKLAVRLKTLQTDNEVGAARLSAGTVLLLAEAASIVRIQSKLQRELGLAPRYGEFEPSSDYGSTVNPAWRVGYLLAEQARQHLGLGAGPIPSMRSLVEEDLGIPVMQAQLQQEIAGATVAVTGDDGREYRGIVLNTVGQNENVWVRRATLAHEVGHLIYDPENNLERVRVDTYDMNHANPEDGLRDYVEQRTNAFAIAFLAPLDSIRASAPTPISGESLSKVMRRYGLSLTAARFHVHNAHYRQYGLPADHDIPSTRPGDDWKAAEDFTTDYFPIRRTPIQRRGRFAGLVAAGYEERLLSEETAAGYLACDVNDFQDNLDTIRSIYPVHTPRS